MQRDYALASADACAHSFPPPRKDIMHKRRWQCVVPCAVHRTVPHRTTPRHAMPRRAMPHRITFPRCGIIAARWQMGVVKRFRPLLHESRRSQPILEIATTHSTRDINIFVVIRRWYSFGWWHVFTKGSLGSVSGNRSTCLKGLEKNSRYARAGFHAASFYCCMTSYLFSVAPDI